MKPTTIPWWSVSALQSLSLSLHESFGFFWDSLSELLALVTLSESVDVELLSESVDVESLSVSVSLALASLSLLWLFSLSSLLLLSVDALSHSLSLLSLLQHALLSSLQSL